MNFSIWKFCTIVSLRNLCFLLFFEAPRVNILFLLNMTCISRDFLIIHGQNTEIDSYKVRLTFSKIQLKAPLFTADFRGLKVKILKNAKTKVCSFKSPLQKLYLSFSSEMPLNCQKPDIKYCALIGYMAKILGCHWLNPTK